MTSDHSENLTHLLTIEKDVRDSSDITELGFTICNKTRLIIPFTQSLLFLGAPGKMRLASASDIAVIDATSPLSTQLETIVNRMEAKETTPIQLPITTDEKQELADLMPPYHVALPLVSASRGLLGFLILTHISDFETHDGPILNHLAGTYGHALATFARRSIRQVISQTLTGQRKWAVGVAFLAISFFPVSITALAPASIRAAQPAIIASPLDGVVDQILVAPNSPIRKGDALVQLVDVELRNDLQVAKRAFRVAEAELLRSRQLAFSSVEDKAQLVELQANLELRRAEMNYFEEQLSRSIIRADRAGIAVIGDTRQWQGRPVMTGEKIMEIAKADEIEIEALLPVADAVTIQPGSLMRVFLDIRPMHAYAAEVAHVPYQSSISEAGILSYKVIARLAEDEVPPRIGLHGTAKVYGPNSTLFYYVFRRPLTALRQIIGW